MDESPEKFGQLLKQAIGTIAARENKGKRYLQDEIGYKLKKKNGEPYQGGSSIEHWCKGNLPPDLFTVEELASELAKRKGLLNRKELKQFLDYAGHPNPTSLINELFPNEAQNEEIALSNSNVSLDTLSQTTSSLLKGSNGPIEKVSLLGKLPIKRKNEALLKRQKETPSINKHTIIIATVVFMIIVLLSGFFIWLERSARAYEDNFRDTTDPLLRLESLAGLFRLQIYDNRAHALFNSLTPNEKMTLFTQARLDLQPEVRIVVEETYKSMFADNTHAIEDRASVLRAMLFALEPTATNNRTVRGEISYWLERHIYMLDDFEDGKIEGRWYAAHANTDEWKPNEVALNVFPSFDTALGTGALECDFDFTRTNDFYPRATFFLVKLPIQDWTEYSALQFQAKSLVHHLDNNIRVFIALTTREDSCWNELGDFQRLGPEYQTFTFQLDRALYKTCKNNFEQYDQPLIGKEHVVRLHVIFTADHKPSGAVLVDEIWLIKP